MTLFLIVASKLPNLTPTSLNFLYRKLRKTIITIFCGVDQNCLASAHDNHPGRVILQNSYDPHSILREGSKSYDLLC